MRRGLVAGGGIAEEALEGVVVSVVGAMGVEVVSKRDEGVEGSALTTDTMLISSLLAPLLALADEEDAVGEEKEKRGIVLHLHQALLGRRRSS